MIKIWNILISSLSILIVSWIALKWLDIVMGEDDVE